MLVMLDLSVAFDSLDEEQLIFCSKAKMAYRVEHNHSFGHTWVDRHILYKLMVRYLNVFLLISDGMLHCQCFLVVSVI